MTAHDPRQGEAADLDEAVSQVLAHTQNPPSTGIILGSGLGGLADQVQSPTIIPFAEIPGFGTSRASGHRGELIVGWLESKPVVAMAGRYHRYEGWTNDDVAFPVQLMAAIGCTKLIVSNAAGGVNPKLNVGDIVVIRDHVNLMGGTFSFHRDRVAPTMMRFHDPYDQELAEIAMQIAVKQSFHAQEGTYLATLGPTYETRSEYRMMRRIGADVVGMSTVPEVLAAAECGLPVLGLSMVSNVANPDQPVSADHTEVLEAGRAAEGKMEAIVRGVLRQA